VLRCRASAWLDAFGFDHVGGAFIAPLQDDSWSIQESKRFDRARTDFALIE
jgi:hypothetical protein